MNIEAESFRFHFTITNAQIFTTFPSALLFSNVRNPRTNKTNILRGIPWVVKLSFPQKIPQSK